MKLIVGLGNPGPQYAKTRHNAGFMVLDRLAEKHAPGAIAKSRFNAAVVEFKLQAMSKVGPVEEQVLLLKPTTFMNKSGMAVREAVNFYKLNAAKDLLVVVDEVYLACGEIRLRPSGGTAGHNGLFDIQRVLGHDQYPRLRVGVGPKPAHFDQADFVLGRFTDEELALVNPAIARAADACQTFVSKGLDAAMNAFNAPDKPETKPAPKPITRDQSEQSKPKNENP